MSYRVWYSTESFAEFIIAKTDLKNKNIIKKKMFESDANNPNNFHTIPDHIKKILYLDAPDLIVELDTEPIFAIEVSMEAGTGHNAFQRFARLAASVENNVPAFYIYPEAAIITRISSSPKWDEINPLIFKALDDMMAIYHIPAFLFYFPSDFRTHTTASNSPNLSRKGLKLDPVRNFAGCPDSRDNEMKSLFEIINELLKVVEKSTAIKGRELLLSRRLLMNRRAFMQNEYYEKGGNLNMSPLTATIKVPTENLLNYLSEYESSKYSIGELLRSRNESILYQVDAKFRGDPYPGALAAIDYLMCREGKTFEERKYNLVMVWGRVEVDDEQESLRIIGDKGTINDFVTAVQASESKNLLTRDYDELHNYEIPRYFMQVRYGSTYSKVKHIRVYSYFADAILFPDGALWRDA